MYLKMILKTAPNKNLTKSTDNVLSITSQQIRIILYHAPIQHFKTPNQPPTKPNNAK